MKLLKLLSITIISIFLWSTAHAQETKLPLKNFYQANPKIDQQVNKVFDGMDDRARVAQMIVTSGGEQGKPEKVVMQLARDNKIGGVVFLKGYKASHKRMIQNLNKISAAQSQLPLIFSIDAEPSLFNSRLKGSKKVMNTIDIKTIKQADSTARIINGELLDLGFHQNFAPVCDISADNVAIKNRSFGKDKAKVIELSNQFIQTTQQQGIVATAKHFPGHGLVIGDTHKNSVYINGALKELAVYPPLITDGVLSIMIAHITIRNNPKYNTGGLPASCSRKIVTDLLKGELGFKGIVITDALNIMKAVTIIDNAPLLASKAGNDMLLMPIDEEKTINSILAEMGKDAAYKLQVYESVKKIIRMKIFLGLVK